MSSFEKCFEEVIMLEGGYSNHSSDRGGKTRYGITEIVARDHGYNGEMRDLPLGKAKEIYKKDYWDALKLDMIKDEKIQQEIFDTGINCGTKNAIKFIQRAYNILVKGSPLVEDGIIGKMTINAINSYPKPERLYKLANAYQVKYYLEIAECREQNEDFIFGWLDKRVKF